MQINSDFAKFASVMRSTRPALSDSTLTDKLLLEKDSTLSIYYAPFDYVNTEAKITICGITPGFQQAVLALQEANTQLNNGASMDVACKKAKEVASFGGTMRNNLISMLDHIGLHKKLGITSSALLFTTHTHLVHYTSALRYPVFVNGENYSGTPGMLSVAMLRRQVETYLLEEVNRLPKGCMFLPLGPKVSEALAHVSRLGAVSESRILDGLPHPSGANAERISYFLGKKTKESLSKKTDPSKLDAAKALLIRKVLSA